MFSRGGARVAVSLIIGALTIVSACQMWPRGSGQPAGAAQVVEVIGAVLHVHMIAGVGEGTDQQVKVGLVIREDDQLQVASGARCRFRTANGSLIQLDPGDGGKARFHVEDLDPAGKAISLQITEGRACHGSGRHGPVTLSELPDPDK